MAFRTTHVGVGRHGEQRGKAIEHNCAHTREEEEGTDDHLGHYREVLSTYRKPLYYNDRTEACHGEEIRMKEN